MVMLVKIYNLGSTTSKPEVPGEDEQGPGEDAEARACHGHHQGQSDHHHDNQRSEFSTFNIVSSYLADENMEQGRQNSNPTLQSPLVKFIYDTLQSLFNLIQFNYDTLQSPLVKFKYDTLIFDVWRAIRRKQHISCSHYSHAPPQVLI